MIPIFTILSLFIFVGLVRTFITEDGQYNYDQKTSFYIALAFGMFQMAIGIFLDLLLF